VTTSAPVRLHRSARAEDRVHAVVERLLRRRGWRPRILPYAGYGTNGWVRVFGRVLLTPPGTGRRDLEGGRGWRRFLCSPSAGVVVTVTVGGQCHEVVSERGGYVDAVLPADLPHGWTDAVLSADGSPDANAPLRIVGPDARLGLVSDIDDTVMVTALPRPLLAFWNTFVRREAVRRPVPGMADLYRELVTYDPDTFVVYLSTGPWNVAPAIQHFLSRLGFPRGPLLMTDWGPTADGWFRSGQQHKRTQLRRLLEELPQLTWLLVGDDGQHDPDLYDEAAAGAPGRVRAVIIRQLTATEQVLTHGTTEPPTERAGGPERPAPCVEQIRAGDGYELLAAVRAHDGLRSPPAC
jgi:phosphatidate phosphatase APP1